MHDLGGRVTSGRAKVERAAEKPRFRVELPADTGALTVIYQDARGRTLASSQFRRDDATSLGNVVPLGAEAATCKLSAQGLTLVPAPRRSDQPLLAASGLD